ncbi:class I SAM-dependent methyltransferase [Marinibaculum pumilum]|uniref:Class I SAM-dependent methyltransferase n=1 Tax=Marinibaculum pumilum TaxID=1766165 RepID=A0ABV7KUW6_9PROT
MDGWINVDKEAASAPDQVVDLEALPWPWPDGSAEAVVLRHVLEHLGAETSVYLGIVKELYRVCRDGAEVTITVPHPRHDQFLNDPTHVRPITPQGLELFSRARCLEWQKAGSANTPLALYLEVDFALQSVNIVPDRLWRDRIARGEASQRDVMEASRLYNNVIAETTIVLRAVKPA